MFVDGKWVGAIGWNGKENVEIERFTGIYANLTNKPTYYEVTDRTFKRIPKPSDESLNEKKRISWMTIGIAPQEAYNTAHPWDSSREIFSFGTFEGDRDMKKPTYYRVEAKGDLYLCDGKTLLIGSINVLL